MSKKENHWYILGAASQVVTKSLRPSAWQVGIWLLLVALFLIGFQTGTFETRLRQDNPLASIALVTALLMALALGAGFALRRWQRAAYANALQDAGPEKLIDVIERSPGARVLPDADALRAQSKAIAYALYGRDEDATNALAEVNWGAKAPLIQAVGLSAEAIVELLCRRHVQRALELSKQARALASVSGAIPGASQSERYYQTCVAVGETLLNTESATSLKWLEEAAADGRFPQLQLLASFGLAVANDRSGNAQRASQLRAFVLQVAPHCAPLQLKPTDFAASGWPAAASWSGSASSSISSANAPFAADVQEHSTRKMLTRVIGFWIACILLILASRLLFTSAE